LILPHDHYGTHLDDRGNTTDTELEKKNFGFAGKTLAEIWSNMVIDDYPTVGEYVNPAESELAEENLLKKDQNWWDVHVRSSQYMTQIVKCCDDKCCAKPRSSYLNVVPDRFLPPPLPILQTSDGLKVPERTTDGSAHKFPSLFAALSLKVNNIIPRSATVFRTILYDLYCPSIQSVLTDRTGKTCHQYFASLVMLRGHSAVHKHKPVHVKPVRPMRVAARRQREMMVVIAHMENGESAEWHDEDDLDLTGLIVPTNRTDVGGLPICGLDSHFSAPWQDE
jgi:hypothetical protein